MPDRSSAEIVRHQSAIQPVAEPSPGLWELLKEDLRAHGGDWTRPGFRAVAVLRFGQWRMGFRRRWMRVPFSLLYRLMFRHVRNNYGIELPSTVQLGRRVIIEHQGGIVIHGLCKIGDDCIIRQNVTLGIRTTDELSAVPKLGNGVDVGAGAALLGEIRVGNGARIGANSVVLRDVPPGSTATGVPARVTIAVQPLKSVS